MAKQLSCPKCGGTNLQVQMVEAGMTTKHKGNGLLGNVNNAARGVAALSTLGMSNLVWKKSKGGSKTTVNMQKVCICQDCGYSWDIK